MEDTGPRCGVCGFTWDRQPPNGLAFDGDLNYLCGSERYRGVRKAKIQQFKRTKLQEFLRHVNALLNGGGGTIYLHLQPRYMELFLEMVDMQLTKMLPEEAFFQDFYHHHTLDTEHVAFQVTDGHPYVSTLNFNTKILSEIGLRDLSAAQMRRLLSKDFKPSRCNISEPNAFQFIEGQEIQDFHESSCIRVSSARFHQKGTADLPDQMWSVCRMPYNVSALAKLYSGGSLFLGIGEEKYSEMKWMPAKEVQQLKILDPQLQVWTEQGRSALLIAKEDEVPRLELTTGRKICEGIRLTETERHSLKAKLLQKLKQEMLWVPRSSDGESDRREPQVPVEVVFHDVVSKESSDLCVVEIKVHYFHGICFTQADGPEAYKLTSVRNGIATLGRLPFGCWLDANRLSTPAFDSTSSARAADDCSVDSGVVSERNDIFSEIEEEDFYKERRHQNIEEWQAEWGTEEESPIVSRPIFSLNWQVSSTITKKGGMVNHEDSDVVLVVPEGAVSREKIDDKPTPASAGSWSEEASNAADVPIESACLASPAQAVIYMSVSTDLQRAKDVLELEETEHIFSPVAEFYAGEGFVFAKQVCISLPHFLPVGFDAHKVKVYHFHKDASGRLVKQTLLRRAAADENSGHSESFYIAARKYNYRNSENQNFTGETKN